MKSRRPKPQYLTTRGKRLVVLEEAEYQRLARIADEWQPELPPPNDTRHYPLEALAIALARDILRARRERVCRKPSWPGVPGFVQRP